MFKDMDQWVEIRRRVLTKEVSKRGACKEYDLEWRSKVPRGRVEPWCIPSSWSCKHLSLG